jgi:hypothetical protein
MSILQEASDKLKAELDATDEEIKFLFKTYEKSLEESLVQIHKQSPTRPFLKPLLHKLKGEAYSLNLDHFAVELEILEAQLLEEHEPSHLSLVTTITALIEHILDTIKY